MFLFKMNEFAKWNCGLTDSKYKLPIALAYGNVKCRKAIESYNPLTMDCEVRGHIFKS